MILKSHKNLFLFLAGILIIGGFLFLGNANNASAATGDVQQCLCIDKTEILSISSADCNARCQSSGGVQSYWTGQAKDYCNNKMLAGNLAPGEVSSCVANLGGSAYEVLCCCKNGAKVIYDANDSTYQGCDNFCSEAGGAQFETTDVSANCADVLTAPTTSNCAETYDLNCCYADCSGKSDVEDCNAGCEATYGSHGAATEALCQQCKTNCFGEATCILDCENGTACTGGSVSGGSTGGTIPGGDGTPNRLPGGDGTPVRATGQGNASLPNFLGITDIKVLFLKIVNFLTDLAIPFAALMLIWSGFLFVTAQGNDTKLVAARKNLIWTIAGIAVIVAAKLIVGYIMEALGVSTTGAGTAMFEKVKALLNQIIGLLFILVTVYFFWGVVEFVRASATGGKEVEEGKKHMVWGIIGMTIMASALAIVGILQSFFK